MTDHAYRFPEGYTPEEIQEHLDQLPSKVKTAGRVAFETFHSADSDAASLWAGYHSKVLWDRAARAAQQLVIDRVDAVLIAEVNSLSGGVDAFNNGVNHGVRALCHKITKAMCDE